MSDQKLEAVFEDREVVDFFKMLRTNLKSVKNGEKKFSGLLSAIVFRDVMEHFENEEGPDGHWAPWSTEPNGGYAAKMQRAGRGGNKILQYSGKLRQGFKPAKVRFSGQELVWFNDAQTKSGFPYAAAHDEGGPTLPSRSFMWLSKKGADDISMQTLQFMLDEGI
jgi:phage gpG-like protein